MLEQDNRTIECIVIDDYAPIGSLRTMTPKHGFFDMKQFLGLAIRLVEAIHNIHQQNVIFRQLSPCNLSIVKIVNNGDSNDHNDNNGNNTNNINMTVEQEDNDGDFERYRVKFIDFSFAQVKSGFVSRSIYYRTKEELYKFRNYVSYVAPEQVYIYIYVHVY